MSQEERFPGCVFSKGGGKASFRGKGAEKDHLLSVGNTREGALLAGGEEKRALRGGSRVSILYLPEKQEKVSLSLSGEGGGLSAAGEGGEKKLTPK